MARMKEMKESVVISTRLEQEMHDRLHEIAALESLSTGRRVSVQELIRGALKFVYEDNERLRECFRRSRAHISKRLKKKLEHNETNS